MKIKEILSRDDLRLGDVIYDKTLGRHYMLAASFVEFDTFACVIDLEHGTVLKDYTEGDSIKFWEKFFREDDGEIVLNTNKMRFGNPLLNMAMALNTIENCFEFSGKKGDYPYE